MASELLIASLTSTMPNPVSVRPSIGARTASARSLPKSTHPRITIVLPSAKIPDEIRPGVIELAKHSVRGNVSVLGDDEPAPSSDGSLYVWTVGFWHDPSIGDRGMRLDCNLDDFTAATGGAFEIEISYNRTVEAFRGLGHVLAISRGLSTFDQPLSSSADSDPDRMSQSDAGSGMKDVHEGHQSDGVRWSGNVGSAICRRETCLFESVGVMIDCSRNGVLKADAVKWLLRHLALMGVNVLQLYCEDTYEIDGEPFFGYFRGPYTEAELREIDDYAFVLGIEVIACIQTLGHLGQMLQWPKYGKLRDTAEVLLAESGETYAFIEKMIQAVTRPLRSKRVHIGMDEAHGVSEGRYRQLFGYKESTTVFTDHLQKVNSICVANGLAPMIWSDMLFCLPAKNNALSGYYDLNTVVSEELTSSIPAEISTVFWDYYHTDSRPYTAKIAQHWQLANKAPWMASGVWTWSRFWTALPFTFATVRASMKASKNPTTGVTAVMTTIWGDEGNECDLYSALPGMLYQAEHAYTQAEEVDAGLLRKKFDGIAGADFDDYVFASKLDDTQPETQPISINTHYTPNIAKFLLWEDPFFSFLSPQYRGYDLESHYLHVATYLEQALSSDFSAMTTIAVPHSVDDFPANKRLQLPYLLARILSLKCHLRERLVHAYRHADHVEFTALAGPAKESRLSRLRALVKELKKVHRRHWFSLYKPFGWEVLDLRYGGLEARLETMHERLIAYLDPRDSSVTRIEELEVDNEVVFEGQRLNLMLDYSRASRPQYV
ncbi:BZ3500_MvSof-1268-A1-R1_Chr2-2g05067 [Microbotryum saponariae]|uniref:beta-N-acetylhexosaminidase n=1 Tax=Microbotryum saponariae TaxID=289078 RepID=A0A2X0L863_9BASI|nr:BZ3500_MvSof-1268-A1-R1_Chr2-2g05067 [Microbotryum saponariae]SDA00828.1 BZ3501_MvSof-1269-A2-R1_Chr2-2g04741 [Microbotryum saponariae]